MFAVVAGAGDVGRTVARALRADGHDVVVIEQDPRALERARDLDVLVIDGNAASPRIQEQANVGKADLLFALTGADEVNLMACALAKMKGVPTLCRITSLDFVDLPGGNAYRAVGADTTVSLEFAAALKIARILEGNRMRNLDLCVGSRYRIIEIPVRPGSQAAGRQIGAIPFDAGTRPIGVISTDQEDEAERFHVATLARELKANDRLVVLARDLESLNAVESLFGKTSGAGEVPERIMILGASTTGIHLARILSQHGKKVTLVEEDAVRLARATPILPNVVLLEGSPTDRQFLLQEGAESMDVVVGATNHEEVNILACLIAKQLGDARAIVLINQPELRYPVEAMGIDLAIPPRLDGISPILREAHVLRKRLHELTILHRGEGQVLVLDITSRSRIVGRSVHKAALPEGALIAAIVRAGEHVVPRPDEVIRVGDRIVVAVESERVGELKKAL